MKKLKRQITSILIMCMLCNSILITSAFGANGSVSFTFADRQGQNAEDTDVAGQNEVTAEDDTAVSFAMPETTSEPEITSEPETVSGSEGESGDNNGMFTYAEQPEKESKTDDNNAQVLDETVDDPYALKYEDDEIKVVLKADEGVLPEGASLTVVEIEPKNDETTEEEQEAPEAEEAEQKITEAEQVSADADQEAAETDQEAAEGNQETTDSKHDGLDVYHNILSGLSEELAEKRRALGTVRMYDICILNEQGTEIEPDGNVNVTINYKDGSIFTEDEIGVAHVENMSSSDSAVLLSEDVEEETVGSAKSEVALEAVEENARKEEVSIEESETENAENSLSDTETEPVEETDIRLLDTEVIKENEDEGIKVSFVTESFSYYLVFGTTQGKTTEPVNIGNYGWIKFATTGKEDTTPRQDYVEPDPEHTPEDQQVKWGFFTTDSTKQNYLPIDPNDPQYMSFLNEERAYKRMVLVRLWQLNNGGQENSYDSDNYTLRTSAGYYWVWHNYIIVDDFELPGYEVEQVKMHTAWSTANNEPDKYTDGLVGTYSVRGFRRSTISTEPGVQNSDLNILDIYTKPIQQREGTRYVLRYVHADGSVSDGNERILGANESVSFNPSNYCRDNEEFSGVSVVAGADTITVDESTGAGTIKYDQKVDLAKVYIYYKQKAENNGITTQPAPYDKDANGNRYTGKKGLYTDKSAETVEGDDRKFILNLESWYVDQAASVGMVLDASGSMAWTSGVPAQMKLTNDQLNIGKWINGSYKKISDYTHSYNNTVSVPDSECIPYDLLKEILDPQYTDNSSMGYNGYHYYLLDERSTVNEYVALGYTDGNTVSENGVSWTKLKGGNSATPGTHNKDTGYAMTTRWLTNGSQEENRGWYYVNSTGTASTYLYNTGKSYDGYARNEWDGNSQSIKAKSLGPLRFYVNNNNELWVAYWNSQVKQVYHSAVYVKRDKMFTKNETLQDAVSQFASILLGSSPESEIAMTRFSQDVGDSNTKFFSSYNYLRLLDWTSDSEKVTAAMNQTPGSYGGKNVGTTQNPLYEYGLTGQTATRTGVTAFQNAYINGTLKPKIDNSKYLIIFTDGKDQYADNKLSDAEYANQGWTGEVVRSLKDKGYKIITVLMKSQAIGDGDDYKKTKAFLTGLASPKDENSDPYETVTLPGKITVGDTNEESRNVNFKIYSNRLYFEADSNSSLELVEHFKEIANTIATGLSGYTVRDYIDPRFDVINDAGDVLTVLDSNGNFTQGVDSTGLRGFTTPDGKQAMLGYDATKKMFYVLWQNQSIPATNINSSKVNLWSTKLRVQAKEDFLGGNNVLSNGNIVSENQVYYPGHENTSSEDSTYPSKTFPLTTVDPGILEDSLDYTEDTIYLGEAVEPDKKLEWLTNTTNKDNSCADYLARFLQKYGSAAVPGNAGTTYRSLISQFMAGDIQEFSIPYYYLDRVNDNTSQTGTDAHRSDKIGTIKYTWTASNNKFKKYATDSTTDIVYTLRVEYTPDSVSDRTNPTKELADNEPRLRSHVGDEHTGTYTAGVCHETVNAGESLQVVKRVYLSELENDATTSIDIDSNLSNKVYHYLKDAKGNTYGYKDYPITVSGDGFSKNLLLRLSKTDNTLTNGTSVVSQWFSVAGNELTPLTDAQTNDISSLISAGESYIELSCTLNDPGATVAQGGTSKTFTITDTNAGKAIIHIESGKIRIQKKILKSSIMTDLGSNVTNTFTFSLTRSYQDPMEEAGAAAKTENRTITLVIGGSGSAEDTTYVTKAAVEALNADSDGYILIDSDWIDNLPFGDYTITETDAGAYEFESVSAGTVVDDAGTVRNETEFEAGSVVANDSKSITFYLNKVSSGKPTVATIDSTRTRLNAQIGIATVKNVSKAKLKVTKKDSVDTTVALSGAVFELFKDSSCTEHVEGTKNASDEAATEFVSDTDGVFIINNLEVNSTYYLREKRAASGHYLLSGVIPVVIDGQGNVTIGTIADQELAGHVWADATTSDIPFDIVVTNSPFFDLPSTGGPGNYIFTIIGVAISAMVILNVLKDKKRGAMG